jgi:hypothetical protein
MKCLILYAPQQTRIRPGTIAAPGTVHFAEEGLHAMNVIAH